MGRFLYFILFSVCLFSLISIHDLYAQKPTSANTPLPKVFISEANYFDKNMRCVATDLSDNKELILSGLMRYCETLKYTRLLTKVVYLSYKNVRFGAKTYNIHFRFSSTKMQHLNYLYFIVLTTTNKAISAQEEKVVLPEALAWLQKFVYYYRNIFLVDRAIEQTEKDLAALKTSYAQNTQDSTKTISGIKTEIGYLVSALARERNELKVRDSTFRVQQNAKRRQISTQDKKLQSLKTLRQNNAKDIGTK